jgi:hypothetical protein
VAARLQGLRVRSRRGQGCLSVVSGERYQGAVSDGLSIIQRSSTECDVPECDREASIIRRSWPTRGCCSMN